jgi:hypothetical protein
LREVARFAALWHVHIMSSQLNVARFLATPEPPHLGPGPRGGTWAESTLESELSTVFQKTSVRAEGQQLIRALVLLWHDHLGTAHEIAQSVENSEGAIVHGIMHRREPDFGNAAYWFRRVGRHAAFSTIARRVSGLAKSKRELEFEQRLLKQGEWDPFAFIDACQSVTTKPDTDEGQLFLREAQRIEFEALFEHFGVSS